MIQVNGLELALSVHCAESDDEADDAKVATRVFDTLSRSKRRRTTKPGVSARPVVYVPETEDLFFRRGGRTKVRNGTQAQ